MSLEALAPQRMIQGASAVGARCWQRAQITHNHGVTPRRSARVATGVVGIWASRENGAICLVRKAARLSCRPAPMPLDVAN
jgi:hypothetical protein